jgi:hypothetical protein
MRQFEKLVEQSELVHHLEGRGMNGIAGKVAQEIAVLFQHQDFDTAAPVDTDTATIMPAGPPAAMQQRTEILSGAMV